MTRLLASGSPTAHRRDIDGLRAVAVLAVVGFHAFPAWVPGGFVGVDVFFVISGYLITGIITRDIAAGIFSVRRFYARRIRRIFPSLLLVLATVLIGGWAVALPLAYAEIGKHVAAASVFASNFALWGEAGYFDAPSGAKALLHLWSLAIEEQFYLIWPLALLLLSRLGRWQPHAMLLLLAGSLGVSIWLTPMDGTAAFYHPLARAFELLIGSVLAVSPLRLPGWARAAASIGGLSAMLGAMFLFTAGTPFPGVAALVPCLGAALYIAAGEAAPLNRWLLGHPVSVAVGLISYPLYLWHWPLLVLPTLATGHAVAPELRAGLVLAAIILAALTTLFVERPIRFGRRQPGTIPLLVGAMALLGGCGMGIWGAAGLPQRYPAEALLLQYENYDFALDARVSTCWLPNQPGLFADECAGDGSLLVWGDSHAARLYAGLAAETGGEVGQYTRDSCPPLVRNASPACREGNIFVEDNLLRSPPAQSVVLFARWTEYARLAGSAEEAALFAELIIGLERLRAGGVPVTFVGPAPDWQEALLPRLYREASAEGAAGIPVRLMPSLMPRLREIDVRLRTIAEASGARYLSLIELMCTAEGCLTMVPGQPSVPFTPDSGHLTTPGARYVARHLFGDLS